MDTIRLILFLLAALSPQALADVDFLNPTLGATLRVGDVLTAQWRESGRLPQISELIKYDLYLCADGDSAGTYVGLVSMLSSVPRENVALLAKDAVFARGNSISFKLNPRKEDNHARTFFLKMVSWGPNASVINFSGRFSIVDMTGPMSTSIWQSLPSTNGSSPLPNGGPFQHEELRKRQVEDAFTVPYQLQTGPTRYAPMAKKPATTIPAKSPIPQFPASAYTIATTYLPPATVQITLSASVTYSVASFENTASPAPHLHDAQMKRFLERWKD
ncbi:putative beta-1,6-glucan biosynthesis protein (Knh1) [Aspergillus saccharolyticus JOP 1030-1]|uniref:Beta-1,6-glucan boisynthesis protein n=1 Tax=Aspergillus saccharolyticus JOP 1030-1 TaxID=1450539 RepID=A0A318Z3L2_9EURO|nr:beta-1,6-glucan boisynthesis protein [Aspergillus saccharolyticus JOP 1030-1]PYH41875.1 beta-1,6-glucan boisynthesis protein [Aspergillus saccharolyticus JOP 1030-1]